MRIREMDMNEIEFIRQDYDEKLYYSIKRIGLSFPIKVEIKNNHYICIDGHKRLSVLEDLILLDPTYAYRGVVPVTIMNNGDSRSNDCSLGRNTH